MNPFDLQGQHFLLLFGLLTFAIVMISYWIARAGEQKTVGPIPELKPLQLAAVFGKERRVVDAALAMLVELGYFQIEEEKIVPTWKQLPTNKFDGRTTQLYNEIKAAVGSEGCGLETVRELAQPFATPFVDEMVERDLLVSSNSSRWGNIATLVLTTSLIAFGVIKTMVGFERGKPVSLLILLMFICPLIIAFMNSGFQEKHRRTKYGKAVYKDYSSREFRDESKNPKEIGFLVACSGLPALIAFEAMTAVPQYSGTTGATCSSCSSCGGCGGGCGCGGCA